MIEPIKGVTPKTPKVIILTSGDSSLVVDSLPPTVPEETSGPTIRIKPVRIKISDTISFKGQKACQPLRPEIAKNEKPNLFKAVSTQPEQGTKLNFFA